MRRLRIWTDGQRVSRASFRDCARIASHSKCRPYVGCPSRATAMFHSAHLDITRPVRELSGRVITASMALFTRRYSPGVAILPPPELITTICTEVNISYLGRVDVLDIRLLKPQFKPELTIDGPLVFRLKYRRSAHRTPTSICDGPSVTTFLWPEAVTIWPRPISKCPWFRRQQQC